MMMKDLSVYNPQRAIKKLGQALVSNTKFNVMKPYFVIILLFCTIFTSCQKFVDIKKTSAQSNIESANDCQLLLDNAEVLNKDYPVDGEISADDYYLDDARYNSDRLDIDDRSLYTWSATAIRQPAKQWVGCYNKIYNANLILEAIVRLEGKEPANVLNNLKGSALFFRAYALWNLAQLYTAPYGQDAVSQPGLPIRLVSDINETPGRGTVKDTYDRILQDLTEGAALLNAASSIATRPNKAAAFAMLSRVYLSMGDYPNALLNATSALQLKSDLIDFNTLNPETPTPFARFNQEVIFHSTLLRQNYVLEPGYGYENQALVNKEIVNAYAEGDLRKTILIKENTDVENPTGTYRFTGNYEPAAGSPVMFNGLTTDELYYTRAECYARAGNTAGAMTDLNTLLRKRWLTGAYTDKAVVNATAALDLVLVERRKGLLMRGLRWMDLRRLNREQRFAKVLSRTVAGKSYTLAPNELRYTLLIPQEVLNNSAIAQNRR